MPRRGKSAGALKTLEVASREAWRAWLAEHHGSASEIWLVYKKGAAGAGWIQYGESVEEALCYGWVDGRVKRLDEVSYVRRFTPRKPKSKWSASNKKRVAALTRAGRMAPAGRRLIEAAKKDGSWDAKPDAEKDWAMPVELEAALGKRANAKARQAFSGLSPSHRKQFVMWVASAKKEETRRRRADKAIAMSVAGDRPM